MKRSLASAAKTVARRFGVDLVPARDFPPDIGPDDIEIIRAVRPYTMTSTERVFALIEAVRYVVKHRVPGDIVECGVWKGGSMMAVARTLKSLGATDRDLHLFDTFEGMTEPGTEDVTYKGHAASKHLGAGSLTARLDEVKTAVKGIGYEPQRLHFVKGDVAQTIPGQAPEVIALLRLDTDWYASTRHELVHLFPRLAPGGVLIVDDYGHWRGARQAVDEYFSENPVPLLLSRIDYSGRLGVKH